MHAARKRPHDAQAARLVSHRRDACYINIILITMRCQSFEFVAAPDVDRLCIQASGDDCRPMHKATTVLQACALPNRSMDETLKHLGQIEGEFTCALWWVSSHTCFCCVRPSSLAVELNVCFLLQWQSVFRPCKLHRLRARLLQVSKTFLNV